MVVILIACMHVARNTSSNFLQILLAPRKLQPCTPLALVFFFLLLQESSTRWLQLRKNCAESQSTSLILPHHLPTTSIKLPYHPQNTTRTFGVIILSSNPSFSKHYHHIISIAYRILGTIRRAFKVTSTATKRPDSLPSASYLSCTSWSWMVHPLLIQ